MKRLITVIALALLIMTANAQTDSGIQFEHGTWAEVKAKAKKENKSIFIDCYTVWCGPCKKLSKEVFPLKEVGDYFNANYINYKVDMEKGEGIELKKLFGVTAFPTLLFVDSNGVVIHKVVGYRPADKLIEAAKKAPEVKILTDKIVKDYETNKKDPVKVRTYLNLLMSTYDGKAGEVAEEYLALIPKDKYLEEDVFAIITRQITDPTSPVIEYLFENKELHDKEIGQYKQTVKGVIDAKFIVKANQLTYAVKAGEAFDEKAFQDLVTLMEYRNFEGKDKLILDTELKLLQFRNDWKGYVAKVESLLESDNYPKKGLAQTIYRWYTPIANSDRNDTEVLKKVVSWMDRLIEEDDNFQLYLYSIVCKDKVKVLKKMNASEEEILTAQVELKLLDMLVKKQKEYNKKNQDQNGKKRGIPAMKMY